ncbi:auxin transporter-like protein 2 isoform X2 [Triticum aestivum]|uniref:auxin transporter-like protein 2 isoform X2 n=1 Tax=Triticum aestivum TaxID=4565 RepID=UPI001D00A0B2|nr:auxin transporter-like protein 2 isoform X2 [Triticum aestivum]
MVPGDQAEESIVAMADGGHGSGKEGARVMDGGEESERGHGDGGFTVKDMLWHGGSVWDAWFSCASNQVAQVLLTLPYSFSQLGMASGLVLQVFYGLMGSWTAYLISVLYVEYRARKEREGVSFKNHVIQWFEVLDGLLGPYWKAAGLAFNCTFLLFGSVIQLIACAREIMHAMWKPRKFKYIYLVATLYVFTLTLPSASTMYWAFGDALLTHSNAFSLLPKSGWRDAAVILMLIHQFITFGFACTPLYFVWEKAIGMHHTGSVLRRALARLPLVLPIWFLAIIFPFFGPINSAVGALLVSFTVYIIPAVAHMLTYRSAHARSNAAEKPPAFLPSWSGMFVVNAFVVAWVLVVGFGLGGWASVSNFVKQIDTFGLFAKCYQCPPRAHLPAAGSPLSAPARH